MTEFSSPAIGSNPHQRIASIDVLRALTMVLMVFINDIVTLKDIPEWLDHVEKGVDGMHVADAVYPAFLFIVGMSLYFAINQRRNKGESDWQQIKHIVVRAAILLLFGAFLINPFTINEQSTGLKNFLWDPLCVICFILIFNTYPKIGNKKTATILKAIGAAILIAMVFIYQLGWRTNRESTDLNHFVPQHWGILGGIGWAYLVSALIMLFSRNKFWPIFIGWAFFCFISMASKAHMIPRGIPFSYISGSITGGTLVGLTMGGVLTSYIFQYFRDKKDNIRLTLFLSGRICCCISRPVNGHPPILETGKARGHTCLAISLQRDYHHCLFTCLLDSGCL